MPKLTKEEFVQRMLADKSAQKRRANNEYVAYAAHNRANQVKKYKWPRTSVKG